MSHYNPTNPDESGHIQRPLTLQTSQGLSRSRYFWILLLALLSLSLVASGIAYYFYTKEIISPVHKSLESLPVITSQGPFKKKPLDPGGSKILHQDKEIYTFLLDGATDQQSLETSLREAPETPLLSDQEPSPEETESHSKVTAPEPREPSRSPLPPSTQNKQTPSLSVSMQQPKDSKDAKPQTLETFLRLVRCSSKAICQKELKALTKKHPKVFSKIPFSMQTEVSGKFALCLGPFPSEKKAQAVLSLLKSHHIPSTLLSSKNKRPSQ